MSNHGQPADLVCGSAPGEPPNAFSDHFLHRLEQPEEPVSARAAETAGLWIVRRVQGGYGVFRHWESVKTATPIGLFERIEVARMAAAVLPVLDQPSTFRLSSEHTFSPFPVLEGDAGCGHLKHFDDALIASINLVQALLCNPSSLALLLHAAGRTAVELAGQQALLLGEDEA